MNFSNNSTLLEYQLVEEFSLKTKVCTGLIAPVLVLLIIFLNFGIVYYERFGNDPQKRNLYNMMITSFFMVFSTSTTFWVVFVSIRIIQGPFDVSNTFTFIVIIGSFQMFAVLCILETIFYKLLAIYNPKTIIGINDDWFHHFFNYWNIMIALIVPLTYYTYGSETPWSLLENLGYPDKYYISLLIGQQQHKNFLKQPTKLRIVLMVLIDISLLVKFIKSRKSNTVQIIPDHQDEPINNVNNQRYNPSLINHREFLTIAIVANLTLLLPILVTFLDYAPIEIAIVFLPIIAAISIPSMFFYFNGKLRQFYLRQFWENAPNFLQTLNPDRVFEINNADNNIELGPLRNLVIVNRQNTGITQEIEIAFN